MGRRRKISLEDLKSKGSTIYHPLLCSKCNKVEVMVDDMVESVICHMCAVHYGPPIVEKKEVQHEEGFPRGWHLYKQFVHADGRVFEHGQEKPELKGTLQPTVIEKKPKLSKYQKEQKKLQKEKKLAEKYKRKQEKLEKLERKKLREQKKLEQESHSEQFFE